jgi:hypothetical protein
MMRVVFLPYTVWLAKTDWLKRAASDFFRLTDGDAEQWC